MQSPTLAASSLVKSLLQGTHQGGGGAGKERGVTSLFQPCFKKNGLCSKGDSVVTSRDTKGSRA